LSTPSTPSKPSIAFCPSGKFVSGGGFHFSDSSSVPMVSFPSGPSEWAVQGANYYNPGSPKGTQQAIVVCLDVATTISSDIGLLPVPSSPPPPHYVSRAVPCPGHVVIGGGFETEPIPATYPNIAHFSSYMLGDPDPLKAQWTVTVDRQDPDGLPTGPTHPHI